jgi:hypothetical protein
MLKSISSDIRTRPGAARRVTCLVVALLAICANANAQDEFNSSSGSQNGNGQSCQQTYSDTERQIVIARDLVDSNFKKQEIGCNGDPGCRRAAGEEYVQQQQELAKQQVDAEAQYTICKTEASGGNTGAPQSSGSAPVSGGGSNPAPGTPQYPYRGYVSNQPQAPSRGNQGPPSLLQALNDAAGSAYPGGPQVLQRAGVQASQVDKTINNGLNDAARKSKAIADAMRQDLINKWTHPMDPGTALTQVIEAWAGNAFGAGAGAAAKVGSEGGSFWKAAKAAASAAAEEGKVTAGFKQTAKAATSVAGSNNEFPPAPPPQQRGMLPTVDDTLRKIAKEKNWKIVVRDGNPAAPRFYGKQGYYPKGPGLKAKSAKLDTNKPLSEQPNAGLASDELTPEEEARGYVRDPATGLVSQGGRHFYSDMDIHGVYDSAGNDVTEQFFDEIIKRQYRDNPIQDVVQHGTHDTWAKRNDPTVAGANYGPQVGDGKTVTVYSPGSTVQLSSISQMKSFYTQNGMNWAALYPNH